MCYSPSLPFLLILFLILKIWQCIRALNFFIPIKNSTLLHSFRVGFEVPTPVSLPLLFYWEISRYFVFQSWCLWCLNILTWWIFLFSPFQLRVFSPKAYFLVMGLSPNSQVIFFQVHILRKSQGSESFLCLPFFFYLLLIKETLYHSLKTQT